MNTSRTKRVLAPAAGMVLAVACIPIAITAVTASSDRGSQAVAADDVDLANTYLPLPPYPPTTIDGPNPGLLNLWSTYTEEGNLYMYDVTDPNNPIEQTMGSLYYGNTRGTIEHLDTLLTHSATTTFGPSYGVFADSPNLGVPAENLLNFDDLTLHAHWVAPFGQELIGIGWADYAGQLLPEHLSIGLLGNIEAIPLWGDVIGLL